MEGVLNVSKRPAKIKLRIEAVGLQAGQTVTLTDVMFQPGGAVSGWLPHVTEMPWAAGINSEQGGQLTWSTGMTS
ncbi:MAG: hypothetical protein ACTII7_07825 [Galactobacter sp.]